jgi:ATP-dependent Clp protease adaptor protein ClpS
MSIPLPDTSIPDKARELEVDVLEKEAVGAAWRVLLYNDEVHSFDEVIWQIIKATGCSRSHAEKLTWQVHHEGKAQVFEGAFEACLKVESVLAEIDLITRIVG